MFGLRILATILASGLTLYLVIALLLPERFQ